MNAYSAGTTIQVGTSDAPSLIMSAVDNSPQVGGLYVVDQDTGWASASPVLVTITGAPSEGTGICVVQYAVHEQRQDVAPSQAPDTYATWRGGLSLPSTFAVALKQGGTTTSPSREFAIELQPVDPTIPAFGWLLSSTPNIDGTSQDYLSFIGYNPQRHAANEPSCYFAIENNFESSTGVYHLECYLQVERVANTDGARPFGFILDRATGQVFPSIQYVGGTFALIGGPVGGPTTQQWVVQDGSISYVPDNYTVAGNNGLTIETLAGLLQINSRANLDLSATEQLIATSGALMQLSAGTQLNLLAGSLAFLAGNTIAIADSGTVQQSIIDNNVSATRFYPTEDNTGSLGIQGKAWSTVTTHAISVAAVPSLSANGGSAGTAPAQVAGYLPITVDGTSYVVPLYNA